MAYQEVFQFLGDFGAFDVVLPFLLVFVLTYGVLNRTKVLDNNNVNAMIAFCIGFFAIIATNVMNVLNALISYLIIVLIAGLMMAMVLGVSGISIGKKNKALAGIVLFMFAIAILAALIQTGVLEWSTVSKLVWPAIITAGLVGILAWNSKKNEEPKKEEKPKKDEKIELTPQEAEMMQRAAFEALAKSRAKKP